MHTDEQQKLSNPKREQILQGAMQVFLESGYERTSMDRVAATAGVSKNTIYNHFQDKEGLFTALIERVTTSRFQIVFGSLPREEEPAIALRRIAEKLLAMLAVDREYISFLRLLIGESDRFPHLAQLFVRTLPKKVLLTLSDYFQSHPELDLANPKATARIFMGSLIGYVLLQEILHGKEILPMEKEEMIESLIALMVRGSI